MKYPAALYAKAFLGAISGAAREKHDKIILNFLKVVRKNGDHLKIEKIFSAIRESVIKKQGGRIVNLEFAREVPEKLTAVFSDYFSNKDYISISRRPDLIAGLRILIDGEKELDNTMKRKLKNLFK